MDWWFLHGGTLWDVQILLLLLLPLGVSLLRHAGARGSQTAVSTRSVVTLLRFHHAPLSARRQVTSSFGLASSPASGMRCRFWNRRVLSAARTRRRSSAPKDVTPWIR